MNTVLLIEDNLNILGTNKEFLEAEGYTVHAAATLEEGGRILEGGQIDLLILDVMLPDGSGIDFCARLRERSDIPVLYLTCLEEEDALISGLKAGGDDYMTKPYSLAVLSARAEALLRRARERPSFTAGPLSVDIVRRKMSLGGVSMPLKPKEFDLLLVFVRAMGKRFTAEELYALAWSEEAVDVRTVAVHISSLRKKIDGSPFYILTERRKYYSLHMDES
ncbi:MAG: response regulator transcription factor [Oscillospiraceae bacterium]|nr:response regulator transcription factor [Oscillospiraceae bacterium]